MEETNVELLFFIMFVFGLVMGVLGTLVFAQYVSNEYERGKWG